MISPFSFAELEKIPQFVLHKPSFIRATDGINLAYYTFAPENPQSIIIFFHGGGLYVNRSYQYIGKQLAEEYNIGSFFIDIRGHGNSEGKRGDAPSTSQIFEDINIFLTIANQKFPNSPIYLVGHSSGGSLLLNYSIYQNKKPDLFAGYILIAPFLGPNVDVNRENAPIFVRKVRTWIFIANQLFKIPFFRHIPAVFFNYPQDVLNKDPKIVTKYTYTMACATTPHNPELIFEQLDKPCKIYIGSNDEQFDPDKVIRFANFNKRMVKGEIVQDATHLSILLKTAKLIYNAIHENYKEIHEKNDQTRIAPRIQKIS